MNQSGAKLRAKQADKKYCRGSFDKNAVCPIPRIRRILILQFFPLDSFVSDLLPKKQMQFDLELARYGDSFPGDIDFHHLDFQHISDGDHFIWVGDKLIR